ncbi:DNA adenine methylase [Evansella sp. AB-P1]|uniref:DNA adenine methylase n=1 Tax=Evansella sp. AB-P1 TaxID=3037653 RepID=UPI00241F30E3|nr:DNA adenine methylase [Evansella sp. AB-P1]MDG5789450.1 DNA adenine methylase [Evansella sp. AB-P1]
MTQTLMETEIESNKSNSSKTLLPFRYPGGKYYAIKKLQPFLDAVEYDEYREPFFGGGAIFWSKPKSTYNWINDLYEDLVLTLQYISDEENRNELLTLFENEMEATKEKYQEVKNLEPQTLLERVYKFYYLNRTSFSGKMKSPSWGYRPKRSLPPHRWKERIIPCGKKLEGVKITNIDFEDVIKAPPRGNKTLLFLDPPYFKAKQESHYVCSFTHEDHLRLAEVVKDTEHYFFLTYDDCDEIRELYNWAYIYDLNFYYRLDNSRDNENKRKTGNEVVITNYPLFIGDSDTVSEEKQESESMVNSDGEQLSLFSTNEIEVKEEKVTFEVMKAVSNNILEKVSPPLRYPGSKFRALKRIAPFFQNVDHDEFREPFLGGGAVFFGKPLVQSNWINDIDRELMITYEIMANETLREQLCEAVKDVQPSKEYFEQLKGQQPTSNFDIAFRFFVINRTAYSGIMNKPNFGFHPIKSVQPDKWPERIRTAGEKLQHARMTNLHFRDVITSPTEYESVFLFVDPPYFKADQKRAYLHSFTEEDHLELLELLRNTNYKFCLTYDNCEEIKHLYSWANVHEETWRYNTANSNHTSRKMGKELIITNY